MEQQPPKTGKFALTYGLILGGISLIFGLMLYSMDMHYERNWTIGVIGLVIMAVVLTLGILNFKKANAGMLSLGQALKIGLGAALVGALIGVLYQYIQANVLDPDFVDNVMELQRAELQANSKLTSEQIDQQIEMGKQYFWIGYPVAIVMNLFFGFIISLIAGLVMKKTQSEY